MAYLLDHLLSESAARRPDGIAVIHEQNSLTYGELEASSNRLAHALLASGVKPGDRVGIYLPKSLESIISVFGIMKAGACYVPLHMASPGRRLAEIARQCEMGCLITSALASKKLAEFSSDLPLKCVFFTEPSPENSLPIGVQRYDFRSSLTGQPCVPPVLTRTDQDLAYVLFTSGSTGKPKGVMLSHLNALTFVKWGYETFAISPDDCLSNHAPLNFDLSVFDIFVAAKAGAALCLVPDGLATFPIRLRDFIADQQITVWYSVPSVLTLLLTHGRLADRALPHLRLILFAGEVFPIKYLRALMQLLPQARFFNLYGPTETNVCTYYEVKHVPEPQTASIPIGRSCANMEVFAIDSRGQRVTVPQQKGVLYARGSNVMQGYYGQPAETEAAFIKNPFVTGREEKLYHTGDWVELDTNGNYHFLGRKDHLVKTGGYRVELGEIEAALYSHPAVREAAAVPVPDELLGNNIKVFAAKEENCAVTELELKHHCGLSLPSYMVPGEIEFRVSLPRTSTDKIDRSYLQKAAKANGADKTMEEIQVWRSPSSDTPGSDHHQAREGPTVNPTRS